MQTLNLGFSLLKASVNYLIKSEEETEVIFKFNSKKGWVISAKMEVSVSPTEVIEKVADSMGFKSTGPKTFEYSATYGNKELLSVQQTDETPADSTSSTPIHEESFILIEKTICSKKESVVSYTGNFRIIENYEC